MVITNGFFVKVMMMTLQMNKNKKSKEKQSNYLKEIIMVIKLLMIFNLMIITSTFTKISVSFFYL